MYVCECGKEFENGQSFGGHKIFCKIASPNLYISCDVCGKDCHVSHLSHHKKSHKENIKCKQCGEIIKNWNGYNIFCNSSCSAKFNNSKRLAFKKIIKCDNCCKEFSVGLKINRKFCSQKCSGEYIKIKTLENWKNDEISMKQLSNSIRRYLLEKFNYKCCQCGWGEKNSHTNTIPLEIDHIDGNSENNKEHNLRVLCPNCHSLTSTYKGANRGYGRRKRNN
jgi:hypothetical protein